VKFCKHEKPRPGQLTPYPVKSNTPTGYWGSGNRVNLHTACRVVRSQLQTRCTSAFKQKLPKTPFPGPAGRQEDVGRRWMDGVTRPCRSTPRTQPAKTAEDKETLGDGSKAMLEKDKCGRLGIWCKVGAGKMIMCGIKRIAKEEAEAGLNNGHRKWRRKMDYIIGQSPNTEYDPATKT
jgi:hypothetical protein